MYSQDLIESVLRHSDIVHVASSYIPVEKKGRNYVALCPFHDDKNPSMQISSEKQIFKCFVCGTGGNAIGFVEKYEKIPFASAVKKVAELSGYSDPRLVEDTPKVSVDPEMAKLHSCINDLQTYYQYALTIPEGKAAREYLKSRDLGDDVIKKYGIGYAPMDGKKTIEYLLAKGHSLKNIEDIGIALARGVGTNDHNAGRITFPLFDPRGQVVGFSARRIVNDDSSKYVNSLECRLFHKGNVLYNYHNVVTSAHRDGYCYVLEGFMDVMALDKAGIPNAVALMGTALTKEHIGLLKRLRCEIRLCLDGDAAGQSNMMKACAPLTKSGLKFRLVDYGNDTRDPDDILRQEGPEAVRAKMNNLVEPVDFQLGYYLHNRKLETAEERQKVLSAFLPYLREKPAGIEFEDMLVKISDATGYQAEAIRELLRQSPKEDEAPEGILLATPKLDPTQGQGFARVLTRLETAERTMIQYMLQSREAIDYFEKNVGSFTSKEVFSTIAEFLIEFAASHDGDPELSQLLAYIGGSGLDETGTVEQTVSEMALAEGLPPVGEKSLGDCAKIIAQETRTLNDKLAAKRAISQGSLDSGALANKELAAKIRNRWAKKPKKG